ncbi:class I SAM-dependent methyltransferase [Thiolapillus sp.]|uniref:class I SAM-dependent methyltransferase n=1 Tax=Thiolapillus sp. TaxID=2017437 RepID=UPI0025D0AFBB|nr:class I SAM-dependent methyltransferase [Thiolapillus sp.]
MSTDSHLSKWNRRHAEAETQGSVAQVLLRNLHLLPASGKALDLACERGANALLLAKSGLETHAWDFSDIAIERLAATAQEEGVDVMAQTRDVVAEPPEADSFDVILVSFFLERTLVPHLIRALRPGGRIFYQTFVKDVYLDRGPGSTAWRLDHNELLHLFQELQIHYYREDGTVCSEPDEVSDLAMLVASRGEE